MSSAVRPCMVGLTLAFFSVMSVTALAQNPDTMPPARAPHRVSQAAPPSEVGTGIYRGQKITYQIVNGRMMFQGDIAIEHVDQMVPAKNYHPGATLDYLQYRWPLVGSVYEIPYTIDPSSGDVTNINTAISTYNSLLAGVIQWVPLTNQTDYVDFLLTGSGNEGNSFIGRVGGKQILGGGVDCTVATLLHEMGHATGFWHEQARPDRDGYVTVDFNNMVTTAYSDSEKQFDDMEAMTLYDWSSIMEYFPLNFSKNGNPVIESIPPGMPLANFVGYSAGDIDAIKRLYQAAPTEVTIATNPAGLQVVVDGATVTTPQTYNWPLYSTHTLGVASTVQTQSGDIQGTTTPTTFYYTYGRWNDNGAQTHTITVLPGNNEVAFPATSPAVTVYMASFIQLVPYSATAYPPGTGTITPNPAPQSYPGASGVYYIARQPVMVTATPNAGQNFYQYIGSPYWVSGGLSVNPKPFLVPDTGNPINLTTYFVPTTSPIYTVDSNPDGSNFYVIVDGSYWPAPTSFSPYYNTAWNANTNHTVAVDSPEYPWTSNTRYLFDSWSDGGALSHSITTSGTSTIYTATLTPDYFLSDYANEPCAGTIGVNPSSPSGDGYYPAGTPLTFTATVNPGWVFTEWQQNLSGTSNPLNVPMNDEITGIADFSTIATPLTLTSMSPSAAIAGAGNFTMTINGTGFTPQTEVYFAGAWPAVKFISSTQITIPVTAAQIATPGGTQLFVENFPSGATCAAYGALPFNVASSPIVTPTPQSVSFTAQLAGTTSAAKSVTLKNNSGSTVSINSIAATGDFAISSSTCGSSLIAGASCSVKITFAPPVSGAITGSLAISDSAPDSPQTVALSGVGNLPVSFTPPTLAFGNVAVGTTSAAKTVTLTNNESTTLSFSTVASGNYAISSTGTTCAGSLASKAKCNIALTFTPTSSGAINGAVTIGTSTTFTPQLVALSGTGTGGGTAPLTFTPANLVFAAEVVGTASAAKTVTVKNTSSGAVTISSFSPSGFFTAGAGTTNPCTPGLNLVAGASCTISATFAPALGSGGMINGGITVVDNATVGSQVFDLKGTASLPLTLAPATLTFAAQTVATTSTAQTVTVTNNSSTALTPTIAGSGDFAVVAGGSTPCTGALGAHAKCTFAVTFTPSAIGTRGAAVTVTDSDNPGVQTLSVTGTGQ